MVEANGLITASCFKSIGTKIPLEGAKFVFVKVVLTSNIIVKRMHMNANPEFLVVIVINVPTRTYQKKRRKKKNCKTYQRNPLSSLGK